MTTKLGSFVLMLHSHLPYYRKAGMWPFGEENLYECMAETYIPLLNALYELKDEGIKAGITVGITPVLAEQLDDAHLKDGFIQYVDQRLKAAYQDIARYPDPDVPHSEHLAFLAKFYAEHFTQLREDFITRYNQDLLSAFKTLQDEGCIEITTSAATHGFLPLLGYDEAIQHQLKVGIESYKRHFGRDPKGIWLPECAYRPSKTWTDSINNETVDRPAVEAFLFDNNLKYFFTEYEAIEGSKAMPFRRDFGVYRDVQYKQSSFGQAPTGLTTDEAYWMKDYPVAVMGRSERASFQVWSAADGYPGDGVYREFHKKDTTSGLHYWRITSKEASFGEKMLYDPIQALKQAEEHAQHYVWLVTTLLKERRLANKAPSLLMVSFDTELYGHWWFEGVHWLKNVIKGLQQVPDLKVETASQYLEQNPPARAIQLPESTWGAGGHFWVWDNPQTDWMWPEIHRRENTMKRLVKQHANEQDGLKKRCLNQLARELLLLEGSDWPFLVTTGQAKDYAVERFQQHCTNFDCLAAMLDSGRFDEESMRTLEETNNLFPNLNYKWFQLPGDVVKPLTPEATTEEAKKVLTIA